MGRQKRIMIGLAGILAIASLAAGIFHLGKREAKVAPLPLSGRKVTVLTNKPHLRSAEMLGDWFREETGAVVRNVVVNYEDMTRRALEDISSASPKLDVFMFWYVDLGLLVQASALADVTDVIEQRRAELRPEDFIPSLYDAFTLYRGRRWALPYDGDTHVLFYRKSLFASRPDITLRLNLINGGIDPVRLSVLYDKAYQDFTPELAPAVQSAMQNASAWPRLPQAIRLLEILTDCLIRALEGQMSPQEALDQAQSQWHHTLEG